VEKDRLRRRPAKPALLLVYSSTSALSKIDLIMSLIIFVFSSKAASFAGGTAKASLLFILLRGLFGR
jgi:hypothetical protein